jgi:predicted nucleic acid-binding protein
VRIFVDANIIISVLNKEYPSFTYTSRILSLGSFKNFALYTSPICLAIAFYFAEKKHKAARAKEKIRLLCDHINIAEAGNAAVQNALKNNKVLDFEDGLEYYSAIESKCDCIVTEDVDDFYFAEIEIIKSENFFEKYMMRR